MKLRGGEILSGYWIERRLNLFYARESYWRIFKTFSKVFAIFESSFWLLCRHCMQWWCGRVATEETMVRFLPIQGQRWQLKFEMLIENFRGYVGSRQLDMNVQSSVENSVGDTELVLIST